MQDTTEGSNFMAKLEYLSKGWFIDLAAQYTVIRGAGYRAWLQGKSVYFYEDLEWAQTWLCLIPHCVSLTHRAYRSS